MKPDSLVYGIYLQINSKANKIYFLGADQFWDTCNNLALKTDWMWRGNI